MNIIIKKKNPTWRPNQNQLGHWKSKHSDGKSIEPNLSVGQMFDSIERALIDKACLYTNSLGIDFVKEEQDALIKEAEETAKKLAGKGGIIKLY